MVSEADSIRKKKTTPNARRTDQAAFDKKGSKVLEAFLNETGLDKSVLQLNCFQELIRHLNSSAKISGLIEKPNEIEQPVAEENEQPAQKTMENQETTSSTNISQKRTAPAQSESKETQVAAKIGDDETATAKNRRKGAARDAKKRKTTSAEKSIVSPSVSSISEMISSTPAIVSTPALKNIADPTVSSTPVTASDVPAPGDSTPMKDPHPIGVINEVPRVAPSPTVSTAATSIDVAPALVPPSASTAVAEPVPVRVVPKVLPGSHLSPCVICKEQIATHSSVLLNPNETIKVLMASVVYGAHMMEEAEEIICKHPLRMCTSHVNLVYKMMCFATGATNVEEVDNAPIGQLLESLQIYRQLKAIRDSHEKKHTSRAPLGTFRMSLRAYFRNYVPMIIPRKKSQDVTITKPTLKAPAVNVQKLLLQAPKNQPLRDFLRKEKLHLTPEDENKLIEAIKIPERRFFPRRDRNTTKGILDKVYDPLAVYTQAAISAGSVPSTSSAPYPTCTQDLVFESQQKRRATARNKRYDVYPEEIRKMMGPVDQYYEQMAAQKRNEMIKIREQARGQDQMNQLESIVQISANPSPKLRTTPTDFASLAKHVMQHSMKLTQTAIPSSPLPPSQPPVDAKKFMRVIPKPGTAIPGSLVRGKFIPRPEKPIGIPVVNQETPPAQQIGVPKTEKIVENGKTSGKIPHSQPKEKKPCPRLNKTSERISSIADGFPVLPREQNVAYHADTTMHMPVETKPGPFLHDQLNQGTPHAQQLRVPKTENIVENGETLGLMPEPVPNRKRLFVIRRRVMRPPVHPVDMPMDMPVETKPESFLRDNLNHKETPAQQLLLPKIEPIEEIGANFGTMPRSIANGEPILPTRKRLVHRPDQSAHMPVETKPEAFLRDTLIQETEPAKQLLEPKSEPTGETGANFGTVTQSIANGAPILPTRKRLAHRPEQTAHMPVETKPGSFLRVSETAPAQQLREPKTETNESATKETALGTVLKHTTTSYIMRKKPDETLKLVPMKRNSNLGLLNMLESVAEEKKPDLTLKLNTTEYTMEKKPDETFKLVSKAQKPNLGFANTSESASKEKKPELVHKLTTTAYTLEKKPDESLKLVPKEQMPNPVLVKTSESAPKEKKPELVLKLATASYSKKKKTDESLKLEVTPKEPKLEVKEDVPVPESSRPQLRSRAMKPEQQQTSRTLRSRQKVSKP